MKITERNYKDFEGKIVKIPSDIKDSFINVEKAVIEKEGGTKFARLKGTVLNNNNGVIFSQYTSKWLLLNDISYTFYSKEEISSFIESVINKKKEDFFNNNRKKR